MLRRAPRSPSPHPCHLSILSNSWLNTGVHGTHHPEPRYPRDQAGIRTDVLNHGEKITVPNSFHSIIPGHLFLIRRESRPHRVLSRQYCLLEICMNTAYFHISCMLSTFSSISGLGFPHTKVIEPPKAAPEWPITEKTAQRRGAEHVALIGFVHHSSLSLPCCSPCVWPTRTAGPSQLWAQVHVSSSPRYAVSPRLVNCSRSRLILPGSAQRPPPPAVIPSLLPPRSFHSAPLCLSFDHWVRTNLKGHLPHQTRTSLVITHASLLTMPLKRKLTFLVPPTRRPS